MPAGTAQTNVLRLLLVDTDARDHDHVCGLLEAAPSTYEIDWQRSYQDGMLALTHNAYDACISEYALGEHSGLELAREGRRREWESPVIMLSRLDDVQAQLDCIQEGAEQFLLKSELNSPLLDRTIRLCIQRHRYKLALKRSNSRYRMLADISATALHNIGNVLNSVGTAAYTLRQSMSDNNRLDNLKKVGKMIEDHKHDPKFFRDGRGAVIPNYLDQVASAAHETFEARLQEVLQMEEAVNLATTVVRGQQSIYKNPGREEFFLLNDVIQTALDLKASTLVAEHINLDRGGCHVQVRGDRIMVTHILINLIQNAAEAIMMGENKQRNMRIYSGQTEDGSACVSVEDNGIGYSQEQGKKLFTRGFTTKVSGNGVGLHFCREAAEMFGGSLTAHSDGLGCGATFTLTFPASKIIA